MNAREAIKAFRKDQGLSQEGLARVLGVTVSTVAKYETKLQPSGKFLGRLAKYSIEKGLTHHSLVFGALTFSVDAPAAMSPLYSVWRKVRASRFAVLRTIDALGTKAEETELKTVAENLLSADETLVTMGAPGPNATELMTYGRNNVQAEKRHVGVSNRSGENSGGQEDTTHQGRFPDKKGSRRRKSPSAGNAAERGQ